MAAPGTVALHAQPVAHRVVPAAARAIRWTAGAINKVYGELAATPFDQIGMISREPMGVVAEDTGGGIPA